MYDYKVEWITGPFSFLRILVLHEALVCYFQNERFVLWCLLISTSKALRARNSWNKSWPGVCDTLCPLPWGSLRHFWSYLGSLGNSETPCGMCVCHPLDERRDENYPVTLVPNVPISAWDWHNMNREQRYNHNDKKRRRKIRRGRSSRRRRRRRRKRIEEEEEEAGEDREEEDG